MSSSTTATLTPETLESDLLAHLSSTTALEDLHSTLLCSLQRTGWTEKIRKLSLELLRAGRCERFDDVVEAVVASAEGRKHPALVDGDHHDEDNSTSTSADVAEGGLRMSMCASPRLSWSRASEPSRRFYGRLSSWRMIPI
ncbi:hypothetical protein AWENTII_007557 [Aspergillus wentii]